MTITKTQYRTLIACKTCHEECGRSCKEVKALRSIGTERGLPSLPCAHALDMLCKSGMNIYINIEIVQICIWLIGIELNSNILRYPSLTAVLVLLVFVG